MKFDAGLQLQDRGTQLVLHSSPGELRRLTRRDSCAAPGGSPQSLTLAWSDRVFGGLDCQITAAFEPGHGDLCGVRLVFRYPEGIPSMLAGFRWLGRNLAERFGPPLYIQGDSEQGEARWAVRGV